MNPFHKLRLSLLLLLPLCLSAQRKWTLDECIQYAVENNINIQQREIDLKMQEIRLNTSKNAWLPDLGFMMAEQVSFGNYNISTGVVKDQTEDESSDLSYTTGRLTLTMPVYGGRRLRNTVEAETFSLEAATANLEKARRDIGIQIASYYLQCLYSKSMEDVARAQVEVSRKLVERATILVNDGKRPLSEKAEAEAQLSNDEYLLADAEGQSVLTCLSLSQLLNLPSVDNFDVAELDSAFENQEFPHPDMMYDDVVESFPSIVAARSLIESGKARVKIAKSAFYPTIDLVSYVGAFYVKMFNREFNPDLSNFNFFRNSMNEVVGLHMSVPIFNRFATRNNVNMAKLGVQNMQLSLDDARLTLRKEIQTAYYNAVVAKGKLEAAQKSVQSSAISVGFEEERYDAGRSNIFDLQMAQQKHLQAQQNAVQAKYEYLIRQRILEFYYN